MSLPRMESKSTGKRARFNDLSVDLLYVIFSHLQSDKRDLCNLALTCQLFREIAQRFIVRNASISHSAYGSRTKLLLRTLIERPDLVAHVHRLELNLLREDIHWPEEQQTIRQLTRQLTNLREFCYLSRDYKAWHYSVPLPLKWTREHAHDQVRRVEWLHNMAPWELRKCMEFPNIASIRVRELQDDSTGRFTSFTLPDRKHRTSSLTELRIGSPSTLAYQALQQLLQMPKSLRKFTLETYDTYTSTMEPTALIPLLESVQESLEELHVETRRNMLSPFPRTARFSTLSSIKKLTVPFRYLWQTEAGRPGFDDEVSLPPQLNELTVSFVSTRSKPARGIVSDGSATLGRFIEEIDRQEGIRPRLSQLTRIILQEHSSHLSFYPDFDYEVLQATMNTWRLNRVNVEYRR